MVSLSNGGEALVDPDDLELVNKFHWSRTRNGYAMNRHGALMHRYILQPTEKGDIDHINGNKLDNRRSNLRIVTRSLNNHNTIKTRALSGYRGVFWCPLMRGKLRSKPWRVGLTYKGKFYSGGYYETIDEAKLARDKLYIKVLPPPDVGKVGSAVHAQAAAFGIPDEDYLLIQARG